jgi:hypothetical protein
MEKNKHSNPFILGIEHTLVGLRPIPVYRPHLILTIDVEIEAKSLEVIDRWLLVMSS